MTPQVYIHYKIIGSCFRLTHAGQCLQHICTPWVQGSTKASGACTPGVKPPTKHGEAFTPRVFASTALKTRITLWSIVPTALKGTCTLMSIPSTRAGESCTHMVKLKTMLLADRYPKLESLKEKPKAKFRASHTPEKPMEPHVLLIINHKTLYLL